MPLLNNNTVKC